MDGAVVSFGVRGLAGEEQDVVQGARELGLRVWDKPAAPCLSSRIAYGQAVTPAKLRQIGQADEGVSIHAPRGGSD